MDIKAKIEEVVARIKEDKDFAAKFSKDPIAAVETIIGVDLPDDQIKLLLEGINGKVNLDKAGGLTWFNQKTILIKDIISSWFDFWFKRN